MNTDEREKTIILAAAMTKVEDLINDTPKAFTDAKKELKTARTYINKVLTKALSNADQTDLTAIHNHINIYDLRRVAPLGCKTTYEHLKVVDVNVLTRLLGDVITDCMLCNKEGKAAQKCKRRKDLIICGLIGNGDEENDCQFKKGVSI